MYTHAGARDRSLISVAVGPPDEHLGGGFPIELAADLILSPHLCGWREPRPYLKRGRRGHRGRAEYFTLIERPAFVLYAARSREHVRLLCDELSPELPKDCTLAVVDVRAGVFYLPQVTGSDERALDTLAPFLNQLIGAQVIAPELFDALAAASRRQPAEDLVGHVARVRVERGARHPQCLWPAFLWRGYHYRWELIRGEVPLAAHFLTPLAANRALLEAVRDAEAFTGERPDEQNGWIRVGRFRIRQSGTNLEIRVRLTAADTRVAFMPIVEQAGSEALPTLAGVLTAGGDNGKTEWMHGYNWSTVVCEIDGEAERLARSLRDTVMKLGAPRVDVLRRDDGEFPQHTDARWVIHYDDSSLTLFMPVSTSR